MRRVEVAPLVGVRVLEVPTPMPGEGEVLVNTSLVGICGSDTHALAGGHPFLNATYFAGHEVVGRVAIGAAVTGLPLGQRVILKPSVACGLCGNCLAQRSNACESLSWIGCDPSKTLAGGMADSFVAPARNLYPISDSVDDETAALIECLATPVHAARIAGDLAGARVVIIGAGTIGVLSLVAAKRAGASSVVMTDLDDSKLARAKRLGATAAVRANAVELVDAVTAALGGKADVVFDCVANEHSIAQAVGLLRRAGTLLLVGVPPKAASVPLPYVQDWELRVQGCAAYTEADIQTAIEIASDGGIPSGEIINSILDLADVVEAFTVASMDSSGKVLLRCGRRAKDATVATRA